MAHDSEVDILKTLSSESDEEGENDKPSPFPVTAPIYVISENPLGSSESRRLDLPADQIILFNKDSKGSLDKILSKS